MALPGFDAANNGRFAVIAVLCLAVLAGWGLDDLTGARVPGRRRQLVLVACAGLLVLPALVVVAGRGTGLDSLGAALRVAWGFEDAEPQGSAAIVRLTALLEWVVLGAAALALVVLRLRGRLGGSAFVALATLLIALDLFKAGMGYNPALPLEHAIQPTTPAIRFLQSQTPERFAALDVRTPLALAYPFPPNVAMRYGVQDVRGYVIPIEERYFELWRRVIAPTRDCYYLFCTQAAPAEPRALNALGLLGVTHLLQHREDPLLRGLRTAYAGPDARIYANPGALPRAFLVGRQAVVPDADAALAAVTAPDFSPSRGGGDRKPDLRASGGAATRLPRHPVGRG